MATKAQIINRAFEEIRISGLTVSQGPTGNIIGLNHLEDLMAQIYEDQNIDVGYNFEETPSINSQTNVSRAHEAMMVANLAVRICTSYGKDPSPIMGRAVGTMKSSCAITARDRTINVRPSRRMPRGSGNTIRDAAWNRFDRSEQLPPSLPGTRALYEGETQNYEEDFSAWLGSNTIASFTITADPRLTVDSSSSSGGVVSYTVTATDNASEGTWQFLQINVTDSAGRVQIRFINFEVITPPEVP